MSAPAFRRTITRGEVAPGGGCRVCRVCRIICSRRCGRRASRRWPMPERTGKRIMILAGRPYHIDPEIGHGIDKLARQPGVCRRQRGQRLSPGAAAADVQVLNQWTYHARLYRAARYAAAASGYGAGAAGLLRLRCRRHHDRRGAQLSWRRAESIIRRSKSTRSRISAR